jgi:recombination protein RecA
VSKDTATIADLLKSIQKKHGPIGSMSTVAKPVTGLTTGHFVLDDLTGVGGLPRGRITELYGQPSSGKTTTALQAAAKLQQRIIAEDRDEHILYLDFEHAMDPDYAGNLGLDVDHPSFIIAQPSWLEEGAEIAELLIKSGKISLSIWDSVAEMTPQDVEFGVRTNAMERARLMNSLLQRMVSLLHQTNCTGVFLNHLVEAVQMGGGRPGHLPPAETSPGGKALKFYSSVRMAFKQVGNKKAKVPDPLTGESIDQVVATNVKVQVTKNKVGNAWRDAIVRVRLGHGFDEFYSALNVLVDHQILTKTTAAMYYFDGGLPAHPDMPRSKQDRPVLHGESAVLDFADAHPQWRDALIGRARDAVAAFGMAEPTVDELILADEG